MSAGWRMGRRRWRKWRRNGFAVRDLARGECDRQSHCSHDGWHALCQLYSAEKTGTLVLLKCCVKVYVPNKLIYFLNVSVNALTIQALMPDLEKVHTGGREFGHVLCSKSSACNTGFLCMTHLLYEGS